MLQVTDQQLTNLHYLRDVVFPHVREREKQGRVDFSLYCSPCGTHRCLLGWALGDDFFIWQGAHLDREGAPIMGREEHPPSLTDLLFGGGVDLYDDLFSVRAVSGSLDTRAARLNKIIAEREAALA